MTTVNEADATGSNRDANVQALAEGVQASTGLEVTLKKLFREQGRIRLQPANPTMQPIYADPDQVQVQGVVVGVMRKY